MKPAPPHSDAAHAAISTELVRLSLASQPERTELLGWQQLLDTTLRRKRRKKAHR